MNETLDRIIKQSGEMWEQRHDRTLSPVLVKTSPGHFGSVFELSLPKGEHHPFWRVSEREMTADESEYLFNVLRKDARGEWEIGALIQNGGEAHYRTRALIYNGRSAGQWLPSMERVRVTIERLD